MAQRRRRGFGAIRKLPSGRFQASYVGPDLNRYPGPHTFDSKTDSEGWLAAERRLIDLGTWEPPAVRKERQEAHEVTVKDLCNRWLQHGLDTKALKASTVASHQRKLDGRVLNTSLADERVCDVDRARIVQWWLEVQERWPNTGNSNANAYKRLHTAFTFGIDQLELIEVNPVQIKGAGRSPRPKTRDRAVLDVSEVDAIVDGMPERLKVPTKLLAWSGLRIGELLELRRKDLYGLDDNGTVTVKVRRTAQRRMNPETKKQAMFSEATPKTDAGNRDVPLPNSLAAELRQHCSEFVAPGDDALIVTTKTGARMMDTTFRNWLLPAKNAAGRSDISPHDFRRFYGTMLVTRGNVSLEEARRLMGHETVAQLLDYQRAADGYGDRAADALEDLMKGK